MNRKIIAAVVLSATLAMAAATVTYAYNQNDIDARTGPSTGIDVNDLAKDIIPATAEQPAHNAGLVNAIDNLDGTYTFEGKTYKIESSWGEHCLTGYAATGNCTSSGKMPTVYHTVSGPRAMRGKICLIKGTRMLSGTGNPSAYDGIYVFEDTGGTAVETGTASTMNVPVVDIYRGTYAAACEVTATGSKVAEVFILTEVK